MTQLFSFFPTLIYRADGAVRDTLNAALEVASLDLASVDKIGQKWSAKHGYQGYTSYGSILHLASEGKAFQTLERILDRHALAFAKSLHWDIRGGKPICDSIWVNVMPEGGSHTSHLHHNAVISGTFYVTVPAGAGPIVFEDPRLPMLMAAPPRLTSAPRAFQAQVSETPKPGTLLLWESWLRHEVPLNRAVGNRISISFNYVIGQK